MNNTAAIFENQFPRIKKVNVVVEYGTPIYPKDLAPEDKNTSVLMYRISFRKRSIKMQN